MASSPPPTPKGNKKASTESLLQRLQKAVTEHHVLPFLDNSDLSRVSRTARFARTSPYQSTLKERELLSYVFKADLKQVAEFFTRPGADLKTILKKVSYQEGYFSQKLRKFVCFRNWTAVSPLQAAYLCGDGPFLGRRLLALLLDNTLPKEVKEKFLAEAKQQLEELQNRIRVDTNTANMNANANAAAAAAPSAAPAVSSNATADSKENADSNSKAEINSGSAATTDEFEFLGALKKLISAYEAYRRQHAFYCGASLKYLEMTTEMTDRMTTQQRASYFSGGDIKWTEEKDTQLWKVWDEVRECQKKVYHYVKLEFFSGSISSRTLSNTLPEFILEPPRVTCRYRNDEVLDLDTLGPLGLYKGYPPGSKRPFHRILAGWAANDQSVIRHLYQLRVGDLRNTITHLHSLKSALSFIKDIKPRPRIDHKT